MMTFSWILKPLCLEILGHFRLNIDVQTVLKFRTRFFFVTSIVTKTSFEKQSREKDVTTYSLKKNVVFSVQGDITPICECHESGFSSRIAIFLRSLGMTFTLYTTRLCRWNPHVYMFVSLARRCVLGWATSSASLRGSSSTGSIGTATIRRWSFLGGVFPHAFFPRLLLCGSLSCYCCSLCRLCTVEFEQLCSEYCCCVVCAD